MSFKPFKPNNQCCDTGATNTPTNEGFQCGPGWECPSGSECLHTHKRDSQDPNEFVCACVTTDKVQHYLETGWSAKNPIARVNKPGREIAALTTPITPVFIREFLGRLPAPPDIAPNALIDSQAQWEQCNIDCWAYYKSHLLGLWYWNDKKWVWECANKCMAPYRQETLRKGPHPDMEY